METTLQVMRDKFLPRCDLSQLPNDVAEIVRTYGGWLSALADGRLRPATEKQRHFAALFRDGGRASTPYERAWVLYLQLCRLEATLRATQNDYSRSRTDVRKLADQGNVFAAKWLKREGPWKELESLGKSIYEPKDGIWLSIQLPGSYGG